MAGSALSDATRPPPSSSAPSQSGQTILQPRSRPLSSIIADSPAHGLADAAVVTQRWNGQARTRPPSSATKLLSTLVSPSGACSLAPVRLRTHSRPRRAIYRDVRQDRLPARSEQASYRVLHSTVADAPQRQRTAQAKRVLSLLLGRKDKVCARARSYDHARPLEAECYRAHSSQGAGVLRPERRRSQVVHELPRRPVLEQEASPPRARSAEDDHGRGTRVATLASTPFVPVVREYMHPGMRPRSRKLYPLHPPPSSELPQ